MKCNSVNISFAKENIVESSSNISFIEFIRQYIERQSKIPNIVTGKKISIGRVKNLKVTLTKVIEYSYENSIPKLKHIGIEFYYSFHKWMESRNYSVNYIGKNIANLKLILNAAYDKKILINTDYKSKRFKVFTEESEEIYLNISELKSIINLNLNNMPEIYTTVRDVFIIGAFTGLRVSDYKRLKTENLVIFYDIKMIKVATKKTGNVVIIPIHSHVKNILQKRNGLLPPKVHENSINPIIKKIGKMAGINKEVTKSITKGGKRVITRYKKYERIMSHTARRSFCTNAYLAGLDSIDIMAISGHKTEKSFLKYIKVTKQEIALRIAKHPFFN